MSERRAINYDIKIKKGSVYHLDSFYNVQGLFPEGTWENCTDDGTPEDGGEYGIFYKNVQIKVRGFING